MLTRIKLQYLLFFTFTLISSVPVLILGVWVQHSALDKEVAAVKEKHLLLAQNLTGDLSRYVVDIESSFRLIANNMANHNTIPGLAEHIRSLNFRYITIMKENGDFMQGLSALPELVQTMSADSITVLAPLLEKAHAKPSTVFYSDLMRDFDDKTVFYLIKAISHDRFVLGSLSTKYIREVQQKIAFGKLGHAAIVDNTGRAIAHPKPSWVASMKDMSRLDPVAHMLRGETGVSQFYSPALEADMIAGFTFVPKVGWGVMVPQPYSELQERANDVKFAAVMITLLGIGIAGLISWVLAGMLARPIQAVVQSTKNTGTDNRPQRVSTKYHFIPLEFGELLGSFNRMVEAIRHNSTIMEETSNRLAEAQRIAHVGNWVWDIDEDTLWCSDEFYRICEIRKKNFNKNYAALEQLFHPDEQDMINFEIQQTLRRGGRFNLEHRLLLQDEKECYVRHEGELHVDPLTQKRRVIGIMHDITDRRRYESELLHRTNYDDITRLPNRTLFLDRINQEIRTSIRNQLKFAVISIDLDDFKTVNETYGHKIGDKLLQESAVRLSQCVRESDTVSRLGGDEFCILVRDIQDEKDCSIIAEKIITTFAPSFVIDGYESFIGASIGIALFPSDNDDANTLIRNADIALFRTKESGGNNYCFFKKEMDRAVADKMSLSNDLRKAVEQNKFLLYFQPIINPETGNITSAEALLRWIHPVRGFIPPDEFIGLAEQTGIIGPLGEWVISTACHTAAQWVKHDDNPPKVSVNLSVKQLKLGLNKDTIADILQSSGLPPQQLIFEITESLVMSDTEATIKWINSIKALGVTFSIDDFGTGYSSLSYLKKLPVDYLKIDRSFIKDMVTNIDDASLVNTIIAIAKILNLKIVAEGVEDQQQLTYLRNAKCDFIQGYFYSKPLPENDFISYLQNHNTQHKKMA